MDNFKLRLRQRRKELGLTQAELAELTGLCHQWVSHYEVGIRKPAFEQLIKLIKALDVSADWLLGINSGEK